MLDSKLIPQLAAELANDPKLLGYNAAIVSGSDNILASLLNSLEGAGAEKILMSSIIRDKFLLGIAPVGPALMSASAQLQAKWTFYLDMAKASDNITIGSPVIQSLLLQLVSDALMTQEAVDGFTKRMGSRAEVLFGADAGVDSNDISKALRGL